MGRPSSAAALILGLLQIALTTALGQAPTVTVNPATQVTSTGATITGSVNPNGSAAACQVFYGTTPAYGTSTPGTLLAAQAAPLPITVQLTGLAPNTTYHYQLRATNSAGPGYSADMTLTTLSGPTVVTGMATGITGTDANLQGTVDIPEGLPTTYYFRWGTTTAYGNTTPPGSLSIMGLSGVSSALSGLGPGMTYHYQLIATNTAGSASGGDQWFTTPSIISIDGHEFTFATTNGAVTIVAYSGPGGDVTIPSTITGLPVTAIGFAVFQSPFPSLTSVTLPSGLTSIGDYAFEYCSLTNVMIPNSVTNIGNFAFSHCWILETLHLSSSLTSIGNYAFWYCGGLTSLAIPDSVTNIGDAAFFFCGNLANLHLGNGLTIIRPSVFFGCSSLTKVTIPDGITNIADGLNVGRALGAFNSCNNLTNVIVGKGLAYLGVAAFGECPNLKSIFFSGNAPIPGENRVFDGSGSVIVYYLAGTTGWEATYSGRPTVLWNPQPQTGSVQQGRFGFNITGTANIPVVIEASTNPFAGSWIPLQSCTLTNGSIHFADPQMATQPGYFYRIRTP